MLKDQVLEELEELAAQLLLHARKMSRDQDDMCELRQCLRTCSEGSNDHALTSGFQLLHTDFSCG